MSMDRLDALGQLLIAHKSMSDKALGLWKADVDSAYRRVPVHPDHRYARILLYHVMASAICVDGCFGLRYGVPAVSR